MSITVPTNTYITLADARTYAVDNTDSELPTAGDGASQDEIDAANAEAEKFLKRAAIAMDRIYGTQYLGTKRVGSTLAWPRDFANGKTFYTGEWSTNIYDSDGNPRSDLASIPPELGYAQTELALMMQEGIVDIYAQPTPTLKKEVNKIDTLETQKEYASVQGYAEDPLFKIRLILRPLLRNNYVGITSTRGK